MLLSISLCQFDCPKQDALDVVEMIKSSLADVLEDEHGQIGMCTASIIILSSLLPKYIVSAYVHIHLKQCLLVER
jgi:hypothetical protein